MRISELLVSIFLNIILLFAHNISFPAAILHFARRSTAVSLFTNELNSLKESNFSSSILLRRIASSLLYILCQHILFYSNLTADSLSASYSVLTVKLKTTTAASLFIQDLAASHQFTFTVFCY